MKLLYYSLLIVFLDQVTKLSIKGINIPFLGIDIQGISYYRYVNIIGSYFQLTFIENPGMAFGLQPVSKIFLTLFTLTAVGLIIYIFFRLRNASLYTRLSLVFIIGGAAGNLIDRLFYGVIYGYAPLFYGKVVDFLHINTPGFYLFGRYYNSLPVFNIADVSITAGLFMVIFGYNKIIKSILADSDMKKLPPEQEIEISA